jgi:hypothetical protein
MRSTTATCPGSPRRPRTLGTEFVHFFLLEQDGEVTLIDAGLSGYRDTLEPALSVFDADSATPASPSARHREKEPKTMPANLCVPRIPSMALTSRVALPGIRS